MSFTVTKSLPFHQPALNYVHSIDCNSRLLAIGGVLSDTRHVWQAKGPYLEIRDTKRGSKIGSWTFGYVLKDSNTKIVDVKELQKSNGKLALLAVALNCSVNGGIVCLFNIFSSKVIRAIQVIEKISNLCVIDSGVEVLNLPGPLHDFDGILSVGTEGGNVLLIDICRQICEDSLMSNTVRDELSPCQLTILTPADITRIDYYRERAVGKGNHLAIHLNVVFDSQTEHFTLKGPKGEDRLHVNKEEVCISALYYCNQLTSLLIGLNFGAFQLWDLTSLKLIYTSPVCDEHIPITSFALQEPTDDPRAFCYIWISYSNMDLYQTGLPFAVMYAICYESKEYHEGYGYLYQNFQYCAIRFQVELGSLEDNKSDKPAKGGVCVGLQPVSKLPASKEPGAHVSSGDTLALCVISWTVWHNENKTHSNALIFDLNQWYKEQMPTFSKWTNCNNFVLQMNLTDLIDPHKHRTSRVLDIKVDEISLRQFVGVQRLEEHFCPTSLTFDIWLLKENEVFSIHSDGLQKALLHHIQTEGPLCLLRPTDIFQRLLVLGLKPLFSDISLNLQAAADIQREIILNVALEQHLLNWLCKCASQWANGRFSSAGCTIEFLLKWAFQRAIVLKTNCDKFCSPLFDYSQSRLDNNTSVLLNSCTGQINVLYKFYLYIISNLSQFISHIDLAEEQKDSLEMVATYFEVLQWLVNVGLLPECHPSKYPRSDNSERISAPYPVKQLIEYYNEKRAHLQLVSKEQFANSDSLLFIDNLINYKCGSELLRKQWQEDGGSGLYPPPSLQSLLRTYLIPHTSIYQKHSLVIYLFLDLAMALDQSKYSPVITYLIQFPAVFKVTPSIIKITQAFWQLDHGDYNTAIEQLLDPFVLKEDLQPWHHNVAMRSLLLQNQHKAALRYLQIRRPPMTDDTSILTAISLYITNNMVTEAFYFMKEHCQTDQDKFLIHLFNECNKNNSLHVLLYKCLSESEEKAFLHYLGNIEQRNSKDLQVFYFLLRSRFLEAFDAHAKNNRKDPDTQGLIGQRNVTHADQIVRIFKNCLPDVNRSLVDYIRKERNNLWKEVPRPTPLSVFVHDTQEKIQYKSTVIHAAIAKAKNTFHDTANNTKINDLLTEETPFLKTPTAFRNAKRQNIPIITPKVIALDEDGEEMGPSPPKRLKLSPRMSTVSYSEAHCQDLHNKMLTPIVRRKTSLDQQHVPDQNLSFNLCTPQSILKVRNLVGRGDTLEENTIGEEEYDSRATATSPLRSNYSIHPRKSLSRSRQHVQFVDVAKLSSSFSDESPRSKAGDSSDFDEKRFHTSSKDTSIAMSSKESTTTTEEFYSLNASLDAKEEPQTNVRNELETEKMIHLEEIQVESEVKQDIGKEDLEPKLTQSPRARKSYKRFIGNSSPVRSSPRLSRSISKVVAESERRIDETSNKTHNAQYDLQVDFRSESEIDETKVKEDNESRSSEAIDNSPPVTNDRSISTAPDSQYLQSPSSPRLLQRIKGRKSLSRRVLEHNSLRRMQNSPFVEERSFNKTEKTSVTEKSRNAVKTTDVESVINTTNTGSFEKGSPYSERKTLSSSSISTRRSNLYSSAVYDPSTDSDSDCSFHYEPDPVLDELKLSDSLTDYVNSLKNKSNIDGINKMSGNIKTNTYEETRDNERAVNRSPKIEDKIESTRTSVGSIIDISDTICSDKKLPHVSSIRSSIYNRRRTSLLSSAHDTSAESDFSFQLDSTFDDLKFSDSVVEYVNDLKIKSKINKTDQTSEYSVKETDVKDDKSSEIKNIKNSPTSSRGTEVSNAEDETANCRKEDREVLSSVTEDNEEISKAIRSEDTKIDTTYQLDIQEVISLDSTDESDEDDCSSSSSYSEDDNLNRRISLVTPASQKKEDEVVEILSSDTEAEAKDNPSDQNAKSTEERQEVSLYSQLEEGSSDGEDLSFVYKDLDDETQATTQALEAEMNEPTYNLENVSDDVFEEFYKEVGTAQTEHAVDCVLEVERAKTVEVIEKSNDKKLKEKAIGESIVSVSFKNVEQPEKGQKQNDAASKETTIKKTENIFQEADERMDVDDTKEQALNKTNFTKTKNKSSPSKARLTKKYKSFQKLREIKTRFEPQGDGTSKCAEAADKQLTHDVTEVEGKSERRTDKVIEIDAMEEESTKKVERVETESEQQEQKLDESDDAIQTKNTNKEKLKCLKVDSSTNTTHFTFDERVLKRKDTDCSKSSPRMKSKDKIKKDISVNMTILSETECSKTSCEIIEEGENESNTTKDARERIKSKQEQSTNTAITTGKEYSLSSEVVKVDVKEKTRISDLTIEESLTYTLAEVETKSEQHMDKVIDTEALRDKNKEKSMKTYSAKNKTNSTVDDGIIRRRVNSKDTIMKNISTNTAIASKTEPSSTFCDINEGKNNYTKETREGIKSKSTHLAITTDKEYSETSEAVKNDVKENTKISLNAAKQLTYKVTEVQTKSELQANKIVETEAIEEELTNKVEGIETKLKQKEHKDVESGRAIKERNKACTTKRKHKSIKTDSSTNTTHFTVDEKVLKRTDTENSTLFTGIKSKDKIKKDISTNTTVSSGVERGKTSTERKVEEIKSNVNKDAKVSIKSKKEESTNTTICKDKEHSATSEAIRENVKEKTKMLEDIFVSVSENPLAKKVYKPKTFKKINIEDPNTSSSDTTEGESDKREIIVTAQVHNASRKKVEEPLTKRLTRRASQLLSQDDAIKSISEMDAKVTLDVIEKKECSKIDLPDTSSQPDDVTLPGLRSRSIFSSSSTQRKFIKKRRSSHSDMKSGDIDCRPSGSKEILQDSKAVTLMRRTRSASVDDIKTYTRKRSLRNSSIDENDETVAGVKTSKPKPRAKSYSVHMPVIIEETKLKRRKTSTCGSALESYSSSRRLTRRQKTIIKGIPTPTTVTAEDDSEVEEQVELDGFDPIKLLDKEPFEGDPDPEEQKVYEQSSPSTSSVSSFTKPRRLSRSTSDVSPEKPPSETSSKKLRSVATNQTDSPAKSTRSRRKSETVSAVSEKPEQVSPPKRSKKNQEDGDEIGANVSGSTRTTRRSRASSVKSEGSAASASKKIGRNKLSSIQELPKITEEKINELGIDISQFGHKESKATKTRTKK